MTQSLSGDQEVLGAERFPCCLERRAHRARNFRVFRFESRQAKRSGAKNFSSSCAFDSWRALFAPPYQSSNATTADSATAASAASALCKRVGIEGLLPLTSAMQAFVSRRYFTGKTSRRGVRGWFRSFGRRYPLLSRSISANHSTGSVIKGSKSTPWPFAVMTQYLGNTQEPSRARLIEQRQRLVD